MSDVRRGYKQTEVGAIPEDWLERTVGELIDFEGGSQPDKTTFRHSSAPGHVRLIQIRDYKTDKFETYVPIALARRFCTGQDIMVGRYGPPIFQILRGLDGAYNVALIKATPKSELHRDYAYYFLIQERLFVFVEKLSQRSSGQTGVDLKELRNYPLPLPPTRAEQEAIAEALSDADALIESLEQLLTKKRQIKQGAMQELLTGKRRLPGFQSKPGYRQTEAGQIPEDWDMASLGKHSQIFGRIGFRGYTVDDIVEEGTGALAINPSNIREGRMVFDKCTYVSWQKYEESPEIKVDEGDVILVKTGSTVGKTAQVKNLPYKATLNPQVVVFKNVMGSRDFFAYLMSTPLIQNQIVSATVGGALPTLSQKLVAAFKFPLPSLSEQHAIAETLSDMDADIAALENKLAKAQQLKQGMMQELLTGRTRLV